jgi:hypothetical protein
MKLSSAAIQTLAEDWYRALDRHVPLTEVLEFLVDEGLEMHFPEGVSRGHAGFADWYNAVTHRFFDERHTLTKVSTHIDGGQASVDVLVNWQARMWTPPAAASEWLGFDADQTWIVVPDPAGRVKVKTYIVNELRPMAGSASLLRPEAR